MKLLLTSGGLTNESISKALFDLVGKPASKTSIGFIPTAMNVEAGEKNWFITDLSNIQKQNCQAIDIVDISALPKDIWLPRLERSDVLFFSGGNTTHLMRWMRKSGLEQLLPKLLKTRVFAGISAGSIVTNPTLAVSSKDKKIYYEEKFGYQSEEGLGFVDLYVRPHLNSPNFPHARKQFLSEVAKGLDKPLYGLDDQSALKITGANVEVISEGEFVKFD